MTEDAELHRRHEELTEWLYHTPGQLPARYVFVLTNLCNLRCPFCFQHRHRTAQPMTAADWLALVPQLPAYARVTLTGGEPLLYPGFAAILAAVAAGNDCNIITNGVLLDEGWIDRLLGHPRLKVLSLSVDDIGNHSRHMKPAEWERMVTMARRFVARRDAAQSATLLDIKTVVLEENAGQLFDIFRYCVEELGCDTHAFQFLKGSPLQHADRMAPFEAIFAPASSPPYRRLDVIRAQLERVREYASRNGTRAFLHPPVGELQGAEPLSELGMLNEPAVDAQRYRPCKFPWASVHINADGELFPCLAVSMGNVKQQRLADVLFSEPFERFRRTLRERGLLPACHRCGWLRPRLPSGAEVV